MSQNEMIDRVARALVAVRNEIVDIAENRPDDLPSENEIARMLARAAIEAMREPTEDQLTEGIAAMSFASNPSDARRCWRAMVDAALK